MNARARWLALPFAMVVAISAAGQDEDSHYVNRGNNQVFDPELGELFRDIGGQVPFSVYDDPAHPYHAIRTGIGKFLFDYAQLDPLLSPETIDPDVQPAPFSDGRSAGVSCAYYLQGGGCPFGGCDSSYGVYVWERLRVNGSIVQIEANVTPGLQLPSPRYVFFNAPGSSSNPWQKLAAGTPPPPAACEGPPADYWTGKPRDIRQAVLNAGHIYVSIKATYGHNVWSLMQRLNDVKWYIEKHRQADLPNDGALIFGGSFGAVAANMTTLLDPESILAGFGGGSMPDFGFNTPWGGWRQINAHRDAGLGTPLWTTPPRTHSYPQFFAIEQMSLPPGFLGTHELGGFSLMQRLPELKRNVLGVAANVDRIQNHHWFQDEFNQNPLTNEWNYFQLSGHAEPPADPNANRYWLIDGDQILSDLLARAGAPAVNPPITPPGPIDPFPQPYGHTLTDPLTTTEFGPSGFLQELPFSAEQFGVMPRIGQGLYPGDYDSVYVGDLDGDMHTEVVFGNFDGFLHVMEVQTNAFGEPLLFDEWRSPPLGWGIAGLQVANLSGMSSPINPPKPSIIASDNTGRLWKSKVLGPNSYSAPVPFTSSTETNGLLLQFVRVGNFKAGQVGSEVVVQDQFHRFHLFSAGGAHLGKSSRVPGGTPESYTGMTGKPVVFDADTTQPGDELLVPCLDGYLRRVSFNGAITSHVYTHPTGTDHLQATLLTAQVHDPNGDPSDGFFVLTGAVGRTPAEGNDTAVHPLLATWFVLGDTAEVTSIFVGPEIDTELITTEWIQAGSTLAIINPSSVGLVSIDASGVVTSLGSGPVTIPDVSGVAPICGAEYYQHPNLASERYLVLPTPSGRIFFYDVVGGSSLVPARTTEHLLRPGNGLPGSSTPKPWPSNASLGWTFAAAHQPATASFPERIHFLESRVPYIDDGGPRARIASIDPNDPAGAIDGFLAAEPYFGPARQRDLDLRVVTTSGQESIEYYPHWEVGAIQPLSLAPNDVRSYESFKPDAPTVSGGYIFYEEPGAISFLQSFDVPILPGYVDLFTDGSGLRYHGQITTQHGINPGGNYGYYIGNSMAIGELPAPGGPKPMVVAGTLGGLVYAVDPSASSNALIHHTAEDLGWGVVGLDIGNVDGDPENEVVVGTWLDTGDWADYQGAIPQRNRGHVVILHPDPNPTSDLNPFTIEEITLDDSYSPNLLASGVMGVRIDDVNDDGKAEIWCGDAAGRLYCLSRNPALGNAYVAVYRSAAIGAYPGVTNSIFPIKDAEGKTRKLVVFCSGYVYRFQVDPDALPF